MVICSKNCIYVPKAGQPPCSWELRDRGCHCAPRVVSTAADYRAPSVHACAQVLAGLRLTEDELAERAEHVCAVCMAAKVAEVVLVPCGECVCVLRSRR